MYQEPQLPGGEERQAARREWEIAMSLPENRQRLAEAYERIGRPVPSVDAQQPAERPKPSAAEIIAVRRLNAGTVHFTYGPSDERVVVPQAHAVAEGMRARAIAAANETARWLASLPTPSRIYFGGPEGPEAWEA